MGTLDGWQVREETTSRNSIGFLAKLSEAHLIDLVCLTSPVTWTTPLHEGPVKKVQVVVLVKRVAAVSKASFRVFENLYYMASLVGLRANDGCSYTESLRHERLYMPISTLDRSSDRYWLLGYLQVQPASKRQKNIEAFLTHPSEDMKCASGTIQVT